MILFAPGTLPSAVATEMRRRANHWLYNGMSTPETMRRLSHSTGYWVADDVQNIIIFTRDEGHHSMGMFKNPDYERCFHLSLSFRSDLTGKPISKDEKLTKMWVDAFFSPDDQRKLWVESPKSEDGKRNDVWHYRMFCDEHWRGIIPRKEVYTTEFTEIGWKSFSELNDGAKAVMAGWGESR
jgi:hypothetical protein